MKIRFEKTKKIKVYITGDTHGGYHKIKNFCKKNETSKDDVLIILGDAGYNYFFNERDTQVKKKIAKMPITLFCIRGNHEARPENVEGILTELFFENTVYVEPDFPNIKYAIDGLNYAIPIEYVSANDFYDIEKYDYDYEDSYFVTKAHTMVIGGAYSVDKYHRIANGWSWFENEQLNDEEKQDIKDYLNFLYSKGNNRIDVFLTHTCPCIYEPTDLFLPMVDQSMVDKSMERFLGEIEFHFPYLAWFWGHYHADREYPIGEDNVRRVMLMDKVLDFSSYMTDLLNETNKTYADYIMNS